MWGRLLDLLHLTTDEKKVKLLSLCDPTDCDLAGFSIQPWDFLGMNTGVGCHFLLQDAINSYILVCLTLTLQTSQMATAYMDTHFYLLTILYNPMLFLARLPLLWLDFSPFLFLPLTLALSGFILLCTHLVLSNSFETPRTVAHQDPLPMGFPRQEYWTGLPFPSSGALPGPGSKLCLLHYKGILYHWALGAAQPCPSGWICFSHMALCISTASNLLVQDKFSRGEAGWDELGYWDGHIHTPVDR